MKDLAELFWIFFKIGAMTFGGGYAMLPFLEKELAVKRKWATNEELMNYFAIGQCTPGVIAVNTATFIGYKRKKIIGSIVATIGIITPSIIIILIVAMVLQNIAHLPAVQSAFAGIRVAVTVLIINAVIKLAKSAIIDIFSIVVFIISGVLSYFLGISPFFLIGAAAAGILIQNVGRKKE